MASSMAMLLVGGTAMAFIGARVVGRPVQELIAAARRIGEGDFGVIESTKRRDEFGEVARALHAMSLDLLAERNRASAETEARIRALQQLRHAERLSTLGQLASVLVERGQLAPAEPLQRRAHVDNPRQGNHLCPAGGPARARHDVDRRSAAGPPGSGAAIV